MSPSRNFIRFAHKADIYDKVTIDNDMGQKKAIWNPSFENVPCLNVKTGPSTSIRFSPTIDEADYYTIYFNHNVQIDYGSRITNIKTRNGDELISDKWFQVIEIDKEISFSGKIQYLEIKIKSVIE